MTDAEADRLSRRNTAIACAFMVAALPVTLPLAVAGFFGWRVVFGWWPGQPAWSGPRYEDRP